MSGRSSVSGAAGAPASGNPFAGDSRVRRRLALNRTIEGLSTLAALIAVAVLLFVVLSVLARGASAISLDFFVNGPAPFGQSGGGIANALVGTAVLVAIAAAIALPVGILVGLYTAEFAPAAIASVVRFALDILNGVPTIVTGIFVFGLLVAGHAQSGWAGSVALAIIMLPIVARSAHEVLALVPTSLQEAALALGIPRWKATLRIIVPSAGGGLITGGLLAIARVTGETAPLLLTSSIASTLISANPSQALASVPVRIFELSESPSPADHAQAWAAGLVLILFVLLLSVLARALYGRSQRRIGAAR